MPFMPFQILGIWLRGLLAVAILSGGFYLLYRWYEESHVVESHVAASPRIVEAPREPGAMPAQPAVEEIGEPSRRVFRFEPGWNRPTLFLCSGLILLAWASLGRQVGYGIRKLTLRPGVAADAAAAPPGPTEPDVDPAADRTGRVRIIPRPDGSELRVECYGPEDAPPIVWTHGWGLDGTAWYYAKKHLADRFRLIVWDLPGAGLSKKPSNNDYRMEKLAADLRDVVDVAGDRPALLVGHSIGGMTTLTLCKEFPDMLGKRVSGLVLAHTTYTNPLRTTRMAAFYTAIEKPVIVPLLYLTIALWPVVWVMNWMSYWNGSIHRSTHKDSFSGGETRVQLDFIARLPLNYRPDVLARGMLGMMAYDATTALAGIAVPTVVVVGDEDATTLPEAGGFISSRIPNAQLVTLAPAKHMGQFEYHDRFDVIVSNLAAECLAGDRVG